jgi:hypothetical protein
MYWNGRDNPAWFALTRETGFKIRRSFLAYPVNRKVAQAIQCLLVLIHDGQGSLRVFLPQPFNGPYAKIADPDNPE